MSDFNRHPQFTEKDLVDWGEPLNNNPQLVTCIKQRLRILCNTKGTSIFPGSQPVSFTSKHKNVLLTEDYWVCEKSDGVRFLLYTCMLPPLSPTQQPISTEEDKQQTASELKPTAFFINRKFEIKYIKDLNFPLSSSFKHENLVDGELLIENHTSVKYIIFDAIIIDGKSIASQPLNTRLDIVKRQIINPLNQIDQSHPFQISIKQMHKSYGVSDVLNNIIPKLGHGNDGLIFTPVNYPYVIGTCDKLLKWKPAELNTIDFKLVVRYDQFRRPYYLLYVAKHSCHVFFDYFSPDEHTLDEWRAPTDGDDNSGIPQGKIIECVYDPLHVTRVNPETLAPLSANVQGIARNGNNNNFTISGVELPPTTERVGGWRYLRTRNDKESANDYSVVSKILTSINDGVTKKDLEELAGKIRVHWKEREEMSKKRKLEE